MMPPPQRILVVDDEPKIARVLADYLKAAGYEPTVVTSGAEVERLVRALKPALILLDVMLPGKSGIDICRDLRASMDVPIIMVSALVQDVDRMLGLEIGADDYICKPFVPREVVLRVKAVLRRRGADVLRSTGPFLLDEARMCVLFHGRRLDLTVSEYRIMRKLLTSPGRVYSRAQLLDEINGGDDDPFERAIDTHIKNIRKKLAKLDPSSTALRSVYGVGYQLDIEG